MIFSIFLRRKTFQKAGKARLKWLFCLGHREWVNIRDLDLPPPPPRIAALPNFTLDVPSGVIYNLYDQHSNPFLCFHFGVSTRMLYFHVPQSQLILQHKTLLTLRPLINRFTWYKTACWIPAILRETSEGTSYYMVRLVFRRYTQIRRSICTSETLRASISVSAGFALFRHSSPSFGSNMYALTQTFLWAEQLSRCCCIRSLLTSHAHSV